MLKELLALYGIVGLSIFVVFTTAALPPPEEATNMVRISHYEPVEDFILNEAKTSLTFKAYGRRWEFTLWDSEVTSEPEEDTSVHFHGSLVGSQEGRASFTISPTWTSGMIIISNDTFWLEATNPAKPDTLFVYRSSDVWIHPAAQVGYAGHAGQKLRRAQPPVLVRADAHLAERATTSTRVFVDQYWLSTAKNPNFNTRTSTMALLNDVNVLYANAGLSQFVFSLADPATYQLSNTWTTAADTDLMLDFLSDWAERNCISTSYDTVLWLVGNNVGGIAYLGSACGALEDYYRTAVGGLVSFSRLYTLKVIAHELGHNRGAGHDFTNQCASGQSTGCQCSIMSYCYPTATTAGGANNFFSQFSINEIKAVCP